MQNDKMGLVALIIAVASLGLGVYNYAAPAPTTESGNFKADVMAVIDDYVEEQRAKATAPQAPTEPVDVSIDDDAVIGDDDAPVTIVEFSDYECPFCGKFFTETLPSIKEKYVDTGKVKYVFRDFPLSFHPNAKPAANAAECVREQTDDETYYAYHNILFQNQQALGTDKLKEYAQQLGGINATELATCMDERRYYDEIDKDMAEGQKYGVSGTPGFFINGRPLVGAQPFTSFESIIEDELSK